MPVMRLPEDPVWDDLKLVAEIDGVPPGHILLQAAKEYARVRTMQLVRQALAAGQLERAGVPR